jgi:hypothetical protein
MNRALHTHRFTVRLQHSLPAEPYPEVRHGHSCDIEISLDRPFTPSDVEVIREKAVAPLDGNVLNKLLSQATGERLVDWLFGELQSSGLGKALQAVAIQETPKNRFLSSHNALFLG